MMPSYQINETQLIKAVTNVNGGMAATVMASDESCDRYKETLVSHQQHHSMEEKGDKTMSSARNELLNALGCLDELEKSITSVHSVPPKTLSTTAEQTDLDQPKYLNASQDENCIERNSSCKRNIVQRQLQSNLPFGNRTFPKGAILNTP